MAGIKQEYIINITANDLASGKVQALGKVFAALDPQLKKTAQVSQESFNQMIKSGKLYQESFVQGGQTFQKFSGVVKDANGKFVEFNATAVKTKNGFNLINQSLTPVESGMQKISGALVGIVARAIPTIAVWSTLRAVFGSVSDVFQQTAKQMADLDFAVRKGLSVVEGVSVVGDVADEVRSSIENLAADTGKSIEDIGKGFAEFTGSNLGVQESLAGTIVATKLATATFEGVAPTVDILIDTYKNLGSTIDGVVIQSDKFKIIASAALAVSDPARLPFKDLTESLKNSVPAAAAAKVALSELLAVTAALADKGKRGAEAGTAIKSAFAFLNDPSRLAKFQNIFPEVVFTNNTFENLKRVLTALKNAPDDLSTLQFIIEAFGKKGADGIALLANSVDDLDGFLNKANESIAKGASGFQKIEERAKLASESIKSLIERNKILQGKIGEAFFTGVTGANDYQKALVALNSFMENTLIPTADRAGKILAFLFQSPALKAIFALENRLRESKTFKVTDGDGKSVENAADTQAQQKIREARQKLREEINKANSDAANGIINPLNPTKITSQSGGNLNALITEMTPEQKQTLEKLKASISSISTGEFGLSSFQIKQKEFNTLIDKSIQKYSVTQSKNKEELGILTKQQLTVAAMVGDYDTILKITKGQGLSAAEFLNLVKNARDLKKEQIKLDKEAFDFSIQIKLQEFDRLKVLGFSEVEISKRKIAELSKYGNKSREVYQEQLKLIEEVNRKTQAVAESINNTFNSSARSLLKNEITPQKFLGNIGDAFQNESINSSAEALTKAFAGTGLSKQFGEALGDFETNPIVKSFIDGARRAAPILSGAIANPGAAGLGSASATGQSGILGGLLGGLFGGGSAPANKTGQFGRVNARTGSNLGGGGFNFGGLAGAGITGVLSGISASSRGGSAGLLGGAGGFLTSGFAKGGILSSLLPTLGPVGLLAGAGLTIASFFSKSKKVESQTQESLISIAPKLDVSNSKLELINRNLVAIKNNQSYVLNQSSYFSAGQNISDQFSILSRRGLL